MVTAILPSLTDDGNSVASTARNKINQRHSAAFSVNSEITITPERYTRSLSHDRTTSHGANVNVNANAKKKAGKPSALAGLVGIFTGCGALVALGLFLPLPAKFGELDGVTQAQAVAYSFYTVAAMALVVAVFVFIGLRRLRGEDGKGWRVLFGGGAGDGASDGLEGRQVRYISCPWLWIWLLLAN